MSQSVATIGATVANIWSSAETFLAPAVNNLDPSLFQNIILGILAIFIPFAIVFLTDLLNKRESRSAFEKMVWSEEVLGSKRVFWLSVIGLATLSFFNGKDVSVLGKVIAILITLVLLLIFGSSFKKMLRFSEGYRPEFEISFLKKLKLAAIFTFGNNLKKDRMVRAWESFWSEKSSYNERDFTKVFIEHIDDAIAQGQYPLVPLLAETYQKNIDKRDRFSVGYEILPKLFEWHEKLWEAEQRWIRRENIKEKIRDSFSQKHLPTFKKWVQQLLSRGYSRPDYYLNWHYFQQQFFPCVAQALLQGRHEPFQLFKYFKSYIDDAETRLEKIEDKDREQRWWNYIMGLFAAFCPVFFETVNGAHNSYDIWHHYFPAEWKVAVGNSENRIPKVILHEFLQWSRQRMFKKDGAEYDKDLTEVINGIFPNVHYRLFPSFLMLLASGDIKYAVQKEPSFFLINTSWSSGESEEEVQKMHIQQDESQKEETVKVIFEYFSHWSLLKIYKDDLTEDEFIGWDMLTKEEQKTIGDRIRKAKLQKALDELNGQEMEDFCRESKWRKHQRKTLIELLQLLIANVI